MTSIRNSLLRRDSDLNFKFLFGFIFILIANIWTLTVNSKALKEQKRVKPKVFDWSMATVLVFFPLLTNWGYKFRNMRQKAKRFWDVRDFNLDFQWDVKTSDIKVGSIDDIRFNALKGFWFPFIWAFFFLIIFNFSYSIKLLKNSTKDEEERKGTAGVVIGFISFGLFLGMLMFIVR